MVEQRYKVEAEKDLRHFFENFNKRLIIKINKSDDEKISRIIDESINDKSRYELIILNKEELESVFKYYKFIGNEYAGSTTELQNKIEKMKHEMEKQKDEYENKLLRNELKIQELEHIKKYKDLELKMKDMEIECLRNNIKL